MPGPRPSVPNGSTQRFTWSTQWLHLSQRFFPGFPSKGKPQIPGKTSQQWRLKTYRDHTRTESFMKMTLITVMTSTGHSDASVCERLSSCAPGATATLDLGRPMHVLLSKHLKTPQKITKCNKFHEDKPYMKRIATRFKMIQRGCWMWVKILGVMFPFGASGAAACRMAALHAVDTLVTPVSAASFHVLQRNNFSSAPFRLCLFLGGGSLSPQEAQS